MAHELDVWLFADLVGTLSLVQGRLSFCYAPEWLAQPNAVALSMSLPLQDETFDDHMTRPFFAGLLPEGQLRRLLARHLQISGQNDFALLDHIGGECAGAVTFLARGQTLPAAAGTKDVRWLSDEEVVVILDELPRRPMLAGQDGLRLSLAGAQDKLPVVFDGHRIGLPRNGTPSSHILRLFDGVIFNVLVGNHDAHAKNFLLLYACQTPVLAPFYDLLSTAVYPTLTPKMAMKIGSKYKFSEVQARHWEQFAQSAGLARSPARKRILELAKALPGAARALLQASGNRYLGNAVVERIVVLIEQRCALTVQRLSAQMTDEAVSPE